MCSLKFKSMKRVIPFFFLSLALCLTSCYDHSAILEKLDDHENRIAHLEELCKEMNTNISSLQAIVDVLQNKDYVTAVAPIEKDGEIIGYTISFSKSKSITIYHGEDGSDGQDGSDGSTPIIGVKMRSDGCYYWTLNGEWLLDDDGNKIPATGETGATGAAGTAGEDGKNGTDGQPGNTPMLKIQDGCWFVSYDNGATWVDLGAAAGGTYNPDSMFRDVQFDPDYMYLTLKDGSQLTVPIERDFVLTLESYSLTCLSNKKYTVAYCLSGATDKFQLSTMSEGGYATYVNEFDETSGEIVIEMTEHAVSGKVIVLANSGTRTVMQTISIKYRELSVVPSAYSATYAEYDVIMDKDFKYLYYFPLMINESTNDGVFKPAKHYIDGTDEDREELLALLQTMGWTMFVNRNCGKEKLENKHSEFLLQPNTDYVIAYCAVTADGEVSELCFSKTFHTKDRRWVSRNGSDIELNYSILDNGNFRIEFTYDPDQTAVITYAVSSTAFIDEPDFPGKYGSQEELREWVQSFYFFELFGRVPYGRLRCTYGSSPEEDWTIVYFSEDMNGCMSPIMVETLEIETDDYIHID